MKKYFKSQPSNNAWWDDDELASNSERFEISNPIGMKLSQLKDWADNLCSQYGENSIISDLDFNDDIASIEIEKE